MKRKLIPALVALLLVAAVLAVCLPAVSRAADESVYTADADTAAEDIVSAWNSGNYDYIQLAADKEIVLDGEEMVVDLAGYDLTATGNGKLYAFDTANDTYDHTLCGTLTVQGVTCASAYTAPNGNYYIALGNGIYTFHRLEMKLTSVSLRMSVAGIYYNATFSADRLIRESVDAYGVAVSLVDMPGKNFRTEDLYTVISGEEMVNGATVNSGIVENIVKEGEDNATRGAMEIYARLYITVDGKDYLSTTGAKKSLKGIMEQLDSSYSSLSKAVCGQLDDFHNTWKESTSWSFTNIGEKTYDLDLINAALDPEENYCHVCRKTVTWEALPAGEVTERVSAVNGGHYYLTDDVTYTGDATSYFAAPSTGGHTACLHLNGHNITATQTLAILCSSSVMNVMGEGTVAGYSAEKDYAAAVWTNNRNENNGIELYGGTYTRVVNDAVAASATAPVIGIGGNGRALNVYAGVVIDGGTGTALYLSSGSSSRNRDGIFNLIGCTVNGNIVITDFNTYASNLEIIDATVNGTVTAKAQQKLTLSGVVKIDELVVPDGVTVSTNSLKDGSSITVDAVGYFTEEKNGLDAYADYFTAADTAKGVFVRNNKLYCGKDYVSDLSITVDADGNHNAYCPVCEESVTWTAVTQAFVDENVSTTQNTGYSLLDDSHYYLAEDITASSANGYSLFGAPGTEGTSCCFHLNGHNLTATATTVFYSANGILNVMGDGTVSGTAHGSYGGVVHSNNRNLNSQMNFYAGTYENSTDSGYVIKIGGNGGRLYFYEDATVKQNGTSGAFSVNAITGRSSCLNFSGTAVYGDVNVNGVAASNTFNASFTMLLDSARISGKLVAAGVNGITLLNDVKIGLLDITEASKVDLTDGTTDGVTIGSGAKVTVKNAGAFAYEYDDAEAVVSCFEAYWRDDSITVRDNVLTYKPNYEMGLQYNSEGKGRCPICQEYYEWTEISDATESVKFSGGHYFLSGDVEFSGDDAFVVSGDAETVSCLHLNGSSITSAQSSAIAAGAGLLNVMGEGNVTGAIAVIADEETSSGTVNLYSGTYSNNAENAAKPVVSVSGNGGTVAVNEDVVILASDGPAAYIGDVTGAGKLQLDRVSLDGDLEIGGVTADSASAVVETYNATVNGDVTVSGVNDIVFAGKTDITGTLSVADGSVFGLEDMVQPDVNIVVDANGVFTSEIAKPRAWSSYFTPADSATNWIIARDGALECSARTELTAADDGDVEVLLAGYEGLSAKYGEMHNHTSAGLSADGRNSLAQWKERMIQLKIDFATIVDHHQVAHMYHDDWQEAPTEESPVVFIGGSEPATNISGLSEYATQNNMHYNMITGDVDKLIAILSDTENFSKFNYSNKYAYDDNEGLLKWSYGDKLYNGVVNNKFKGYDPTEYSNDPDGKFDYYDYAKWTKEEFEKLVKAFYDSGCLLVEVHPDYPSYIKSTNALDYCFSGDAGTEEAAAMGFEIHTANYGYNPSRSYNEQAYQLWLDMLDAGKKVYATYGDDTHKLPTAMSLTTIYAHDGATSDDYMAKMNAGNFAPGWVGIRMMVGETQMGGTADTFEGQRLVFSIGDMYEANEWSKIYRDKANTEQTLIWEPGYDAECTYTVRLYDDSGLLQESETNPSEMNYYAFDAAADAKFYRVEVWTEKLNEDGTVAYRYRCGVSQPIWNAAAYAAESSAE